MAVIRPLSAGISFEISFGNIILSVDRSVKLSVEKQKWQQQQLPYDFCI